MTISGKASDFLIVTPKFFTSCGQERLRLREAVVDEDVVDVDVGADVERHDLVHRAVVGVGRLDVEHPIDAVHLLLDRRRHRLLDGERVGARVRRRQVDLRRQDLRKLRDGQAEQRHDADEDGDDRDDHRDDGAADEECGHARPPSALRRARRDGAAGPRPRAGRGLRIDQRAVADLLHAVDDDAVALGDALRR